MDIVVFVVLVFASVAVLGFLAGMLMAAKRAGGVLLGSFRDWHGHLGLLFGAAVIGAFVGGALAYGAVAPSGHVGGSGGRVMFSDSARFLADLGVVGIFFSSSVVSLAAGLLLGVRSIGMYFSPVASAGGR